MLLHTGDELVQVECQRIPLTREERMKKGFKASGIFWLLAVCCLPIPLMHFILVPLNLALGGIKAWSFWTSQAVINDGHTKCPRCQAAVTFTDQPEKWPLKILCQACGYQVRLYPS